MLCPLRHPGDPDLRPQVHSECIGNDHDLLGLHVFVMKPHAGQTLNPLWGIICGHQLRPLPHPAYLVEPAAPGFRRHLDAVFGLERRCERGTEPSRAAPSIGPAGFFEWGA